MNDILLWTGDPVCNWLGLQGWLGLWTLNNRLALDTALGDNDRMIISPLVYYVYGLKGGALLVMQQHQFKTPNEAMAEHRSKPQEVFMRHGLMTRTSCDTFGCRLLNKNTFTLQKDIVIFSI